MVCGYVYLSLIMGIADQEKCTVFGGIEVVDTHIQGVVLWACQLLRSDIVCHRIVEARVCVTRQGHTSGYMYS